MGLLPNSPLILKTCKPFLLHFSSGRSNPGTFFMDVFIPLMAKQGLTTCMCTYLYIKLTRPQWPYWKVPNRQILYFKIVVTNKQIKKYVKQIIPLKVYSQYNWIYFMTHTQSSTYITEVKIVLSSWLVSGSTGNDQ